MDAVGHSSILPLIDLTQPTSVQSVSPVSPAIPTAQSSSSSSRKTEPVSGLNIDVKATSLREDLVTEHPAPDLSAVADPIPVPQIPMQPPTIDAIGRSKLTGSRIFLDICCGVNSPLSTAVQNLQGDVMRFDILVHNSDDLLDSNCYEQLLRLCASGIVAYTGTSPSCCEYSRLKLLPHGPPALRTPDHMDGVPGISGPNLLKVQESALMLQRCIQCVHLTIASGGHGHIEQPKSAMSWNEPIVQQFISQHKCACVSMAACGYGKDWHKFWLFASTFYALSRMACSCDHPPNSHQQIAGVRTHTGQYLSRETAEYPPALANQFAQIILPLLSDQGQELTISNFEQYLPVKDVTSPPFVRQDGAGFPSKGDWSGPHNFDDCFNTLRKNFFNSILSARLDQTLLRAFNEQQAEPPFSDEQLQPFKHFLDEFLLAQGIQPDWSIPPDQQLCLHILQKLCHCMQDPDTDLFPYLIAGVPLGIHEEILPSKCFPLNLNDNPYEPPLLSVHHTNWQSAEDDPTTVQELINKEVDAGWVEPFNGTLGLALSDSRPPRLVLDSTVCGVNPQSRIPEKAALPTARDVVRSYPLRASTRKISGVSFDVKSAHKQMAVHPSYRGYLCFQFRGQIYFYKVCPFGAVISAHFWSRLGGAFQRLFHRLCYLPHASFLYVDDLLMFQETTIIGLSASVIAIMCMLLRLPISWKKCELGPTIMWIGWEFHLSAGFIVLPTPKKHKLLDLIEKLLTSSHCSKKTLEKFLGLALWVTQLWPSMRTWLHYLYRDLHSIPASQFSVDPGSWEAVCECVSESLVFFKKPPFSAIPINGQLIQVRHQPVKTKQDLLTCALSDKRVWLRIRDPNSSKRKFSQSSNRILQMYLQWIQHLPPAKSMWPKPHWQGICVADAYATGDHCGIGGMIYFPTGQCSWFSLPLRSSDFVDLKIPLHDNLQKDIASLETLAQIALVYITTQYFPGSRIPIRIPMLSDNTTAEAVSNKLFSTQMPIALFLEKLSLLIASSHVDVEVSHIAGHSNDQADALSRWDGIGDPPHHFMYHDRFPLSLPTLWNLERHPTLHPPDTRLPWTLPA